MIVFFYFGHNFTLVAFHKKTEMTNLHTKSGFEGAYPPVPFQIEIEMVHLSQPTVTYRYMFQSPVSSDTLDATAIILTSQIGSDAQTVVVHPTNSMQLTYDNDKWSILHYGYFGDTGDPIIMFDNRNGQSVPVPLAPSFMGPGPGYKFSALRWKSGSDIVQPPATGSGSGDPYIRSMLC